MEAIGTDEQRAINKAIERLLGLWWSDMTEQAVLEAFGPQVQARVWTLYRFAVRHPFDPSRATVEVGYAQVQDSLMNDFPFLSEASVRRLANCFAYAWK